MRVLFSGVHSGPNPSPGIGTARSIRAAFADAELVAVDYSTRSSGLHDPIFDSVWLARPWEELDLDLHARTIEERLGPDGLWLSGLDLETIWLARSHPDLPGVLAPGDKAVRMTAKPEIRAREWLGFSVPPYVSTVESDWELHRFCRRFGWRVWLKGPYHEAMRIRSWHDLIATRAELEQRWATGELFLQADVTGVEWSISFAAHRGALVGAITMTKRETTSEGKTWAGRVDPLPPEMCAPLTDTVQRLGWNGGAEIECVRDAKGTLWVIDWNPRFPAWIHGATLAGQNLPAALVAAATGREAAPQRTVSREFTRVVYEVPVRPELPLPALSEPAGVGVHLVGKHPSATTQLAKRIHGAEGSRRTRQARPTPVPGSVLEDVATAPLGELSTPARILLPRTATSQFAGAMEATGAVGRRLGIDLSVGYSIKTNPDPELLEMAYGCGLLGEAISAAEVRAALRTGWEPERIVLNGPAKSWTGNGQHPVPAVKVTFSDSLEELAELVRDERQPYVGVRIRPPALRSRFGIAVDDPERYARLLRLIRSAPVDRPLAIHFHMASNVVGVLDWWTLFDAVVESAQELARSSERPLHLLDVGGGWFPDDWFAEFIPGLEDRLRNAMAVFPELREVIVEPGKALTQPIHALVVRVLQIRGGRGSRPGGREIVVDGAISDLPEAHSYPHRVLVGDGDGGWRSVSRGGDRLLGRICMEHDVLARDLRLPPDLREGDTLVIADAGAYDRSMSYAFGGGR